MEENQKNNDVEESTQAAEAVSEKTEEVNLKETVESAEVKAEETEKPKKKGKKAKGEVPEAAEVKAEPIAEVKPVGDRKDLKALFERLYNLDLSDAIEPKGDLSYISWSRAWAELCKNLSETDTVSYRIIFNEYGMPYTYDPVTGYYVFTEVTINGDSRMMWLPVMDGANRAMKAEPYEVTYMAYGREKTAKVQPATATDINKALMRCLVKNLAMFGLGLRVYNGEDLPSDEGDREKKPEEQKNPQKSSNQNSGQKQGNSNAAASQKQASAQNNANAKPNQQASQPQQKTQSDAGKKPDVNPDTIIEDLGDLAKAYVDGMLKAMEEKKITIEQVCSRAAWQYCNGNLYKLRMKDFTKLKETVDRSSAPAAKPETPPEEKVNS